MIAYGDTISITIFKQQSEWLQKAFLDSGYSKSLLFT